MGFVPQNVHSGCGLVVVYGVPEVDFRKLATMPSPTLPPSSPPPSSPLPAPSPIPAPSPSPTFHSPPSPLTDLSRSHLPNLSLPRLSPLRPTPSSASWLVMGSCPMSSSSMPMASSSGRLEVPQEELGG